MLKRLILTNLFTALGAAIGVQLFVWQAPWLIQRYGGFYISQGIPYASTGAVAGLMSAEGLLLAVRAGERSKARKRISTALSSEALMQGMPLEEQAVVLEAVRKSLEDQENE